MIPVFDFSWPLLGLEERRGEEEREKEDGPERCGEEDESRAPVHWVRGEVEGEGFDFFLERSG